MPGERKLRALALLTAGEAEGVTTKRLCQVCAEFTATTGAGIMLMAGHVPRGSICTTDPVSDCIEQVQYALGEGPCVDAYNSDRPVLEPDLRNPEAPRWAAFAGPVLEAGARAVFGFPLRVGAVRLGALNLYRNTAGPLTDDQHADALAMADVVAETVLMLQAEAAPGQIAAELETDANFQYVVHQAAGMVAIQLGVSIGQALIHLRAYAFGNSRPLAAVAVDVVARTLRFHADG